MRRVQAPSRNGPCVQRSVHTQRPSASMQGRAVKHLSQAPAYDCTRCWEGYSIKKEWLYTQNPAPCPCKQEDLKSEKAPKEFKPLKLDSKVPLEVVDSSLMKGLSAK